MSMLEIRNIHQAFRTGFWLRRTPILHDISLSVASGSITGFLGPNGAGKTTLIHLITGIRRPVSGTITLQGVDVRLPESRRKLGYLPERPYFYDHLTGDQLLHYFGQLSGMSRNQIQSRIPQVLARVGLSHAQHRELRAYSKGMLQRIGIAQAILHDPEFLVLDEPMSGLDPVGRKDIRELIQDIGREGRTIFFSSHIIPDVEMICDHVAMIQKGKLIAQGPVSHLLQRGNRETELSVSGLETSALSPLALPGVTRSWKSADGLLRLKIDNPAQVTPALQKLIYAGATIIEVRPEHASLEDWFNVSE